jgi:hypothetical protein
MPYSFLLEYGGVSVCVCVNINTHTLLHIQEEKALYDLIRLYFSIHSFKFWYKLSALWFSLGCHDFIHQLSY